MDKFSLKLIPKELRKMSVVKVICEDESISKTGCGFDIFVEYKMGLFWDYIYIPNKYKDISPAVLIDKIKQEVNLTKQKVEDFLKREVAYKSKREYNATEITRFINEEIGFVGDVLSKCVDDKIYSKYNKNYIIAQLKTNKSPLQIVNEARIDYSENITKQDLIINEIGEITILTREENE